MDSHWLPAHGANNLRSLQKLDMDIMLREGHPGYYPSALMSYVHWTSRSRRARHHAVPFHRDRGFLFGDSGGFSISTLGLSLDPIDVLRWQARVCSVGCLLDVPPHDPKRNWIWEKALPRTLEMTRRALPTYQSIRRSSNNPFRWWGVVHGMPGEQQHAWWSAVSEVYPFDGDGEGWALKPNPSVTVTTVGATVRFAAQHNIARLHVLMCTQPTCVATLLCLATMAGLKLVTFDSSTFAMSGSKRVIVRPILDGLSYRSVQEEFRATHGKASYVGLTGERRHPVHSVARDYLARECPCEGCVYMRAKVAQDPTFWAKDSRLGYWFILHNFDVQRQTFAALTAAVAADPEGVLRAVLTPKERGEALRAFEGREAIGTLTGTHRSLLDFLP